MNSNSSVGYTVFAFTTLTDLYLGKSRSIESLFSSRKKKQRNLIENERQQPVFYQTPAQNEKKTFIYLTHIYSSNPINSYFTTFYFDSLKNIILHAEMVILIPHSISKWLNDRTIFNCDICFFFLYTHTRYGTYILLLFLFCFELWLNVRVFRICNTQRCIHNFNQIIHVTPIWTQYCYCHLVSRS